MMKPELKTFVAALLAALGLMAVTAGAALATPQFYVEGEALEGTRAALGSSGEAEFLMGEFSIHCTGATGTGVIEEGGTAKGEALLEGCYIPELEKVCHIYNEGEEGQILGAGTGTLVEREEKTYLLVENETGHLATLHLEGEECPLAEEYVINGTIVFYMSQASNNKLSHELQTLTPKEMEELFPEDAIFFGKTQVHFDGEEGGPIKASAHLKKEESVMPNWGTEAGMPMPNYALTLKNTGSGAGQVNCEVNEGEKTDKPCATEYLEGTKLKLIEVPDKGSESKGYANGTGSAKGCGMSCEFTIDEESGVDAIFEPESTTEYELAINTTGSGAGQVNCEVNEGEKTDEPCASKYKEGKKLKLIGAPDLTSEFANFEKGTGNAKGCASSCQFTLTEDSEVDAAFDPKPEFRLEGETFDKAEITEEPLEGSVGKGELSAITGEVKPACGNGNLSGSVVKGGTATLHVLFNACVVKGSEKPCKVYEGLGEAGDPETLFGEGHLLTSGEGKLVLHEGKHYLLVEGSGEARQLASFYVYGASCALDVGTEPLHLVLTGSTVLSLPDALTSKVEHTMETIAPATLESLFVEDSLSLNGRAAGLAGATAAAAHLSSGEKWSAEASEFLLKGKTFTEAEVAEKAIEGSVGEMEISAVAGEIATSCASGNLDGAAIKGGTAKVHILYNECTVKGAEETCSVYEGLGKEGEPESLTGKDHLLTSEKGNLLEHEKAEKHYLLLEGSGKEKEAASFFVYGTSCPYNEGTEPLHLVLSGSTVLYLPDALENKVEHTLETIAPETLGSLFPSDGLSLNGEEAHVAGETVAKVHLTSNKKWSAQ